MKRLLLFISFVFCFVVSYTQPVVIRSGPANTTIDSRSGALYNFYLPRFLDTSAANLSKGIDSCGAQIYVYATNSVWYRACSPKRWVDIGSGGSATPNINNIGSGNRLWSPQVPGLKTIVAGALTIIDSVTNPNSLTFRVDSANINKFRFGVTGEDDFNNSGNRAIDMNLGNWRVDSANLVFINSYKASTGGRFSFLINRSTDKQHALDYSSLQVASELSQDYSPLDSSLAIVCYAGRPAAVGVGVPQWNIATGDSSFSATANKIKFNIDTLRANSYFGTNQLPYATSLLAMNTVMVDTITGEFYRGFQSTPTWQQTLIAGPDFSQNNVSDFNAHKWVINDGDSLFLNGDGTTSRRFVLALDSSFFFYNGEAGGSGQSVIEFGAGKTLILSGNTANGQIWQRPFIGGGILATIDDLANGGGIYQSFGSSGATALMYIGIRPDIQEGFVRAVTYPANKLSLYGPSDTRYIKLYSDTTQFGGLERRTDPTQKYLSIDTISGYVYWTDAGAAGDAVFQNAGLLDTLLTPSITGDTLRIKSIRVTGSGGITVTPTITADQIAYAITGTFVDTLYRTPGKDSIQFTIGGRYHTIKDSTGGGSSGITINSTSITGGASTRILWENASNQVTSTADFTFNTSRQLQISNGSNAMAFQGGGSTNAGLYFSTNSPSASASGFALSFNSMTINEPSSGTAAVYGTVQFNPPTIVAAGGAVTNTTTVHIVDAPSAVGAVNYSLWVDAGESRFDANVGIGVTNPASILDVSGTVNFASLGTASTDTTTYKPLGISSTGALLPMTSWVTGSPDETTLGLQELGSAIKGQSLGVNFGAAATALSLTDGRIYFQAVRIPVDATLTGAGTYLRTQGDYTADNNNRVALYSIDAATGTMTQIASSTNNGNLYKGATNSYIKEPFSSTIAVTKGTYFLAWIYNNSAQTTAPQFLRAAVVGSANQYIYDFPNSIKLNGIISSQTNLPSPTQASSGITLSQEAYWMFVY